MAVEEKNFFFGEKISTPDAKKEGFLIETSKGVLNSFTKDQIEGWFKAKDKRASQLLLGEAQLFTAVNLEISPKF